jgi:rhodanese-related sulfurtransferase
MQFVINNWQLFLALIAVLAALAAPIVVQRLQGIETIGPSQAVLLVNRQSAVIVDVSEAADYKAGHIPGAISAPLSTLSQSGGPLDKLKERPVVVVCRTGSRSLKAAVMLRRRGIKTVHLLSGGVAAWEKQSLPLEK